jgi:hypothetical protein
MRQQLRIYKTAIYKDRNAPPGASVVNYNADEIRNRKRRRDMTLKKLLEQLNSIPKKHLNTDVRVSVDALIDEGITENFWFTDVEVREPSSGLDRPEIIISGSE